MSLASKSTTLQSYNMLVYRAALHPEFFSIDGRKRVTNGEYDFEAWIARGSHAIRFEHNGICVTEVVTDDPEKMPDRGLVTTLPCAGEKDHEAEFADRIVHTTSMQTETLTDHLFLGTHAEMLEHGRCCDGLMSAWSNEPGKGNLSVIDTQRYADEVFVQCYHLHGDCGLVLRTQSIFQIKNGD